VQTEAWALGCVLYELVTLRKPFPGATFLKLKVRICQGNLAAPVPASFTATMHALVHGLLTVAASERLTIPAVLLALLGLTSEHNTTHAGTLSNIQQEELRVELENHIGLDRLLQAKKATVALLAAAALQGCNDALTSQVAGALTDILGPAMQQFLPALTTLCVHDSYP